MAKIFEVIPTKTYATRDSAIKAVERTVGCAGIVGHEPRYFVMKTEDGRYAPVFVGQDAVSAMVHFHFNVVG